MKLGCTNDAFSGKLSTSQPSYLLKLGPCCSLRAKMAYSFLLDTLT